MIDVKIENNTAKVLGEFGSAMGRALYAIGVSAQGDVIKEMNRTIYTRDPKKKYTYKLTGRLRGSISFVTPDAESGVYDNNADSSDALSGKGLENTVIIGTNVEYAEKVNRKRKFMENGIEPNWDKYQKIAKDIFEGKL
jgi:hypothetical protein